MVHTTRHTTRSAQETASLGQEFGHSLVTARGTVPVICCWGELGSGKTTFIQGMARGLGIASRILSPTFVLLRRYTLPKSSGHLFHFDLYRLDDSGDIRSLGIPEILSEPGSVLVIEWPQRLGDDIPRVRTDIRFRVVSDGSHEISVEREGNDR